MSKPRALREAPAPQADRPHRRREVLRRPDRRRPPRDDDRPDRGGVRRVCAPTARKVVSLLREGERVTGARLRDLETGREFDVRAKQVINATGVWTDDTQEMVGGRGQIKVQASKGVHLVVPRDRIASSTGLILRTEKSVLFVIPWGRHWIVGTTDTPWALDKAHPAATAKDIDYVLDHVNSVLRTPLTSADVEGVYAGLRPLLSGESDATSKLSREHVVAHPAPGLVVVAGGKYTTYRVMAKDAVDEASRGPGREGAGVHHRRPAARRRRGLPRAVEPAAHARRAVRAARRPDRAPAAPAGLAHPRAAGAGRGRPVAGRAARGQRGLPARRGRLRRLARGRPAPRRRAGPPHPAVDRDLGPRARRRRAGRPAHGPACSAGTRSQSRTRCKHYVGRVAAERDSQTQPVDAVADAARLAAEDVVPAVLEPGRLPARSALLGRAGPDASPGPGDGARPVLVLLLAVGPGPSWAATGRPGASCGAAPPDRASSRRRGPRRTPPRATPSRAPSAGPRARRARRRGSA